MKYLIPLFLLAFASVASAQDCANGRCAQPGRVTVTTITTRGGLTVYPATTQPVIVCNGVTCYQAGTIYYYTYPIQERPARRGFRLFGCR